MPSRKTARKTAKRAEKVRSRKPGKFKRILKYTGIGVLAGLVGYGGWHFVNTYYPQVAAGIKSGSLSVFTPKGLYAYAQAHGLLSVSTAIGVGSGIFAGARTALWAGKKMHLSDKSTKRIRNVAMVVGGLVGAAHPVVTTLLAIVCYKDNRKVVYRWAKGAWKWLKPKLKAGWEKVKPHLKEGLRKGWDKTREGARKGAVSVRDKIAERRGRQPVETQYTVVPAEAGQVERLAEVKTQIKKLEDRHYRKLGDPLSPKELEELERLREERSTLS